MVAFGMLWRHDRNLSLALDIAAKAIVVQDKSCTDTNKRIKQLETELLQTQRAGFAQLAKDLDVPVEDLLEGNLKPTLHNDPQAVYRAMDNATATEVKFRQIKVVCGELKYVIGQIIECLTDETLTDQNRRVLFDAAPYSDQPSRMRRLVENPLVTFKEPPRKLGQRPPEEPDDHIRSP